MLKQGLWFPNLHSLFTQEPSAGVTRPLSEGGYSAKWLRDFLETADETDLAQGALFSVPREISLSPKGHILKMVSSSKPDPAAEVGPRGALGAPGGPWGPLVIPWGPWMPRGALVPYPDLPWAPCPMNACESS